MDIEARLAAIEETQSRILHLLVKKEPKIEGTLTLKEAAEYVGYSPDHFRRLAVEQRIIPFSRPSGQQKGKLLFRKTALDRFLSESTNEEQTKAQPGRKRKSKELRVW
ncbi:MAG: helix-turn-helix domain-containing protein [Desulfobulbaceae bacterium]|nr:MAG: helix-turn-helix domain-containing protein [Desulfobulbaceae bacterium]